MYRIAFVNPPGKFRYLRDYYCGSIAKSNYYYPPIDFLWLSAGLDFPCKVFDAIVDNISLKQLIKKLVSYNPHFIFCLISGISFKDDLLFIKTVKKYLREVKLIVLGDICRDYYKDLLLKYLEIDAVLISFVCTKIKEILINFPPTHPFPGCAIRLEEGSIIEEVEKMPSGDFKIGIPKWEIFPINKYRFPFVKRIPCATVLTDYGCPFTCPFCPIGMLPWRKREFEEIKKEINYLLSLGIREIHFRDQTFGVDKQLTIALLEFMMKKDVTWSCFTRLDIISKELIIMMKKAGCHTIIFGVESGVYDNRKKYDKPISDALIKEVLSWCSEVGINTVGTFIIGLPGENETDILKTIEFAKSLSLDYASFNIAYPRFGSRLLKDCLLELEDKENFDSDFYKKLGFMSYQKSKKFVRLANRRFYLRLPYLVKKIKKTKSLPVLLNEIKIGLGLIKR